MRVAAIYDIHGNLPALEAVLTDIEKYDVDQIVVGGDVVVGPMSKECLEMLLEMDIRTQFIYGNCEVAVQNQASGKPHGKLPETVLEDIKWTTKQLKQSQIKLIKQWPMTLSLEVSGLGRVLFCHATPRNENEIFSRKTSKDKLLPIFDSVDEKVVICGHTHMQFDKIIGKTRVVNAGSVGMPYGRRGAYWLLLGPSIELMSVNYDLDMTSELILRTGYPHAKDFVEKSVLNPVSEATMLEIFEQAELK